MLRRQILGKVAKYLPVFHPLLLNDASFTPRLVLSFFGGFETVH
jgi:hypothetical protein